MPKSVEDHVAEMLAEIQAGRDDPLEASNHRTPTPGAPKEKTAPGAEDTEAIHVFFVKDSEVQAALLDAKSVEAEVPAQPQPVTPPPIGRKTVTRITMVLSVGVFTTCVLISILLFLLFIVPTLFVPMATVTVTPKTAIASATATIQLHGRMSPALTLSQNQTAPATGKRHQNATQAQGTITFYNGLFTSQAVGAGTILTGKDGVQVITDQPATIPAASPPFIGQVTVSAHARDAGLQGNIQAYDINGQCCFTAVKAVNTTGFSGGQNEREYTIVARGDIDAAAGTIKASLAKGQQAALQAQVNPGEGLVTSPCSNQIITNHKAEDEATTVTVTVSETCSGLTYDTLMLHQEAMQMITKEAAKQ